MKNQILAILSVLVMTSTAFSQSDWKDVLNEQLALYGHRNWILIVDAAYPLQSKPAITTLVTAEDQLAVVETVLGAVEQAAHVSSEIFLDKEIDFVPESEARGIGRYKKQLFQLLDDREVNKILHEELISEVDDAAQLFNILVLKTNMTIPYTSVFIRLNCGYWNNEQENRLRMLMK